MLNLTTGKVKLMAASGASPSNDTKYNSTARKAVMANRPIAIGVAWRRKWAATGPVVRSVVTGARERLQIV